MKKYKKNRCTHFILALFLGLCIVSCTVKEPTSENKQLAKHVIVIGIDGMSPNGILNASTPTLDNLMQQGAYTLNARAVLPTSSSTNWATMVSGAGPEQHGVTSNDWERDDFVLPPVTTGKEDIFPTIFNLLREQKPDATIAAIYHWGGFGRLIERSLLDYDQNPENERATAAMAADYIKKEKPDFLFVHLDHVDHAGHHYGHKTESYYKSISSADSLISDIIQATKEAGTFEDTIFIISSDHGGIGYGHGGETLDEIEIPFIIFGKDIKKGFLIQHEVYQYDNAATVAYLFGLLQPLAWIGKPVRSAIEGNEDFVNQSQQGATISAPIIFPKAHLYEPAGGHFVDKTATMRIESMGDVDIFYTLDGQEPTTASNRYEGPVVLKESAMVTAKSFGKNNSQSGLAKAYFRLVDSGKGQGVSYAYYEGENWKFLPVFENLQPIKSGHNYQIRLDSIPQRDDQFAIRYSGKLKLNQSGTYRFYLASDDGSKLYINDKLIVDNDGGHGVLERSGSVDLNAGWVDLVVEYFNEAGGAWLDTYYKGPGIPKQIIPSNQLFLSIPS